MGKVKDQLEFQFMQPTSALEIGDRVRNIINNERGEVGRTMAGLNEDHFYVQYDNGSTGWELAEHLEVVGLEDFYNLRKSNNVGPKCECGAYTIHWAPADAHSSWCPLNKWGNLK